MVEERQAYDVHPLHQQQRQQPYLINSLWCHGRSASKPLCSLSYLGNLGAALCGDALCDASDPVIERHHSTCDNRERADRLIDSTTVLRWQCRTRGTASKVQAKTEAVYAPPILHHRGRTDTAGRFVLLFPGKWQRQPVNTLRLDKASPL